MSYLFQTNLFARYKARAATGAKVTRVSGERLAKFKFPIPSLEEQERIADILDTFEALVNDSTQGLQAEIAAREQQYAYYRDHLLSFPRLSKGNKGYSSNFAANTPNTPIAPNHIH